MVGSLSCHSERSEESALGRGWEVRIPRRYAPRDDRTSLLIDARVASAQFDTRALTPGDATSKPGIDWLTFQREHAEDTLVNPTEGLATYKPLECLDTERELAQCQ